MLELRQQQEQQEQCPLPEVAWSRQSRPWIGSLWYQAEALVWRGRSHACRCFCVSYSWWIGQRDKGRGMGECCYVCWEARASEQQQQQQRSGIRLLRCWSCVSNRSNRSYRSGARCLRLRGRGSRALGLARCGIKQRLWFGEVEATLAAASVYHKRHGG